MKCNNNSAESTCKSRKSRKTLAYILAVAAAVIGICKLFELVRTKRYDRKNQGSPVKQYFSLLNARKILPYDGCVDGIVASSFLSAVSIDLTDVCLKEDAFISLNALCSAVNITVPDNMTVKFDGYYKSAAVHNEAENGPEGSKTLYVVVKASASAINIKRA